MGRCYTLTGQSQAGIIKTLPQYNIYHQRRIVKYSLKITKCRHTVTASFWQRFCLRGPCRPLLTLHSIVHHQMDRINWRRTTVTWGAVEASRQLARQGK